MSRKRYSWSEARIAKYIRAGRGTGTGNSYQPWLTVSDVPSRGRSRRAFWEKTRREHHLLSDNEFCAFQVFSWRNCTEDIREQFPIRDRNETLALSRKLGIRHPRCPHGNIPIVVTTDLLITRQAGAGTQNFAYAVKEEEDLEDPRVIEKLEVERAYWEDRNVPWKMLLSGDLKTFGAENLAWILAAPKLSDPHFDGESQQLKPVLQRYFDRNPEVPIVALCLAVDRALGHPHGFSLAIARGLLARKALSTDLAGLVRVHERAAKNFLWR